MSLKEFTRLDKSAWMDVIQEASAHLGTDEGFSLESGNRGRLVYELWRDQLWVQVQGSVKTWMRCDPKLLLTDFGSSATNETFQTTGLDTFVFIGEYDPTLNVQRFYGAINSGSVQLEHVDPGSPWGVPSPSYSDDNWRAGGIFRNGATGSSGAEGYRFNGSSSGWLFFESAEPGTWPAGYALCANTSIKLSGVSYEHVLCQVDLSDEGGATGPPGGDGMAALVPTANWYRTSDAGTVHPIAHAGPLAGLDVAFDSLQFVPDGDSTVVAPKGRLFMFNQNVNAGGGSNLHREPVGPASAGTIMNKFVKVLDWNPTGKDPTAGNVSRVHLRQIILSRCRFLEETAIGSGGIGIAVPPANKGIERYPIFYHPPSDTIRFIWDGGLGSGGSDGPQTEVAFSLAVELDNLSIPTNRGKAETGKTITYEVTALGDVGEPVSGAEIDWGLDRRSTVGEDIGNPGAGGVYTVENGPIDGESATDNSLVVYEDDSPLTVTTHYTVVLATGAITGVGAVFDNAKEYHCDYEHQQTGAQPPHGILRTTQSTTNSVGKAAARVEVPDDDSIATEFDGISADEAP